jgi:hypothetical protein
MARVQSPADRHEAGRGGNWIWSYEFLGALQCRAQDPWFIREAEPADYFGSVAVVC